jgi:hypothetical protein
MWIVSRLTLSPAKNYREPRQAEVLSRHDFAALVRNQHWGVSELHYDGFYQYAICQKAI